MNICTTHDDILPHFTGDDKRKTRCAGGEAGRVVGTIADNSAFYRLSNSVPATCVSSVDSEAKFWLNLVISPTAVDCSPTLRSMVDSWLDSESIEAWMCCSDWVIVLTDSALEEANLRTS